MSALLGYQYVVLRCVPRVDREEFLNVGVVLYSQAADFLEAASASTRTGSARWRRRSTSTAVEALAARPSAAVCAGTRHGRPAALAGHWARGSAGSAPRAAPSIQPGPVHGGLTADPAATLPALVGRLVG